MRPPRHVLNPRSTAACRAATHLLEGGRARITAQNRPRSHCVGVWLATIAAKPPALFHINKTSEGTMTPPTPPMLPATLRLQDTPCRFFTLAMRARQGVSITVCEAKSSVRRSVPSFEKNGYHPADYSATVTLALRARRSITLEVMTDRRTPVMRPSRCSLRMKLLRLFSRAC